MGELGCGREIGVLELKLGDSVLRYSVNCNLPAGHNTRTKCKYEQGDLVISTAWGIGVEEQKRIFRARNDDRLRREAREREVRDQERRDAYWGKQAERIEARHGKATA